MKRFLIWDVPVRLFHWLLAGSFLGAFVIANVVDDEAALFTAHMWLGGIAAFMVILRVLWGFVGTRWARFGSFRLAPGALLGYLKGVITGKGEQEPGHNPATSWAALAMFVIVPALAITGATMSRGGEVFEEVHEILAWAMIVVVAMHVGGIVWHTLRRRDNIALSMVDGKQPTEPSNAIPRTHALAGVAFLALTGLWAGGLYDGYDPGTRTVTLPIVGATLQLGEDEEHEGDEHDEYEHEEHDDDDHDD